MKRSETNRTDNTNVIDFATKSNSHHQSVSIARYGFAILIPIVLAFAWDGFSSLIDPIIQNPLVDFFLELLVALLINAVSVFFGAHILDFDRRKTNAILTIWQLCVCGFLNGAAVALCAYVAVNLLQVSRGITYTIAIVLITFVLAVLGPVFPLIMFTTEQNIKKLIASSFSNFQKKWFLSLPLSLAILIVFGLLWYGLRLFLPLNSLYTCVPESLYGILWLLATKIFFKKTGSGAKIMIN